jgi:hypothetical protein
VQYELGQQPDANWVLSNGNTVATQTVNADASILRNGADIAGTSFEGTWRVGSDGDDDFMGFVFGYQNRGQFYLFDWKQGSQDAGYGFGEQGMTIKVVNKGSDPTKEDLWPTAGSANVTPLVHNTIPYADNVDYGFFLNFQPDPTGPDFQVIVKQGNTVLEDWVIDDDTYASGEFGFYNYSQGNVRYAGFTQDDDPGDIGAVPEPTSMALAAMALCATGLTVMRRRR